MSDRRQYGNSLGQLARYRFLRDRTAMFGTLVIAMAVILALVAHVVMPDSTPNANRQVIELSAQRPGSTFTFLLIPNGTPNDDGVLGMLLGGRPDNVRWVPIYSYSFSSDTVEVERFTGAEPNEGELMRVSMAELCPKGTVDCNSWVLENSIRSKTFWLGTDRFGRDMLSRMVLGTRVSLSVGFIAVILSLLIGILLGSMAGFFRGWIDRLVMWFVTVVWSIPLLLLVIAITLAMGKGFWQVFVAVGMAMWVEVARIVRGQILAIREKEFVEACRALGFGGFRTIVRHILPNIMGPVIVISAANFASAILIEAGLSFLGIGAQPPIPSWGSMIKDHYGYIIMDKAYLAIIPGAAILLMVLAFTLVGNGLRDALDVKARD
jgi:ABC-type dipeptide/oligopeptide/nickel transport system permease subunit